MQKKLTIGIDASRAFAENPAGPEYYSWNLVRSIAKVDKQNQFVLYLRKGQLPNFQLPRNFKARVIGLPYLWTQVGLAIETLLRPPSVLFVPAHTLPILTRILRPHLPIVVTVHGLEGKFLPQSGNFLAHIYRNWSITWAVRLATRLIAVSQDTMSDIINTYHINTKKIEVVHEGVDFRKFSNFQFSIFKAQKIRQKYGIGKDPYVLFVGTVQPRKNLIRLIKAFAMVSQTKPKRAKIQLIIAGKLGWMYDKILKEPKRAGIEDRVKFIGRISDQDLPLLYKEAEVFVLPSITEGFGLPILEAQAAGVPVVASGRGAIKEVAGKGALFVNPASTEDIARGLRTVLENRSLQRQLVREGKLNSVKFSWDKAACRTLKILRDLDR
ncbi:MAG: glycosyltransferase family 4 protein [Candidatus Blackburnbacteria bacterium]|nr:glycosyltransferase family 4 protein [Candidatus Blackburnbacteria bacterium]